MMPSKMILTFLLFCLMGFNSSCSRKQKLTKTTFDLTSSQLVNGTQMAGGIYLWAVPLDGASPPLKMDLDADDSVSIPFGQYYLHVVGYEGPGAWQGNNQCGGTLNAVLLEEVEVTITINLTTEECGLQQIYADMMNEKAASLVSPNQWDIAQWDSSTWGP
ncbi:MAG: hypothetical protein EP326_02280 [Deltaproteobacteria bacterium]|nr:MAG: hypothetical protein EP326_02280 [Deltaproteobacteria bacterium]